MALCNFFKSSPVFSDRSGSFDRFTTALPTGDAPQRAPGHSSNPTPHGGNRRHFMPLPHGLSIVRRARYTQHRPTPKGVAGFECRAAKRERATTSSSTGSSSASNSTASHSFMGSSLRGKLQLALHTIDYTHTHTTAPRARLRSFHSILGESDQTPSWGPAVEWGFGPSQPANT